MSTNVLAFAETRGGDLRRAALEAVTAARAIADARGGQVHAVLFGAPGIGAPKRTAWTCPPRASAMARAAVTASRAARR